MVLRKKSLLELFAEMNKYILTCIMFTGVTMLDVTLSIVQGTMLDSAGYLHLLNRFILCFIFTLTLAIVKHIQSVVVLKYVFHFIICLVVQLGYTYIQLLPVFQPVFGEIEFTLPEYTFWAVQTVVIVYTVIILTSIIYKLIPTMNKREC